jgi:hypothetical protein
MLAMGIATPSSGTGTVADLAIYVPFEIATSFVIKELWWINGTVVAGNVDVGVVNEAGTLLVHSGATAASGTSAAQVVDVTDTTLAAPNRYYLAIHATSASQRFLRIVPAAVLLEGLGIMQESVATDIPDTATFAAMTNAILPFFGINGHTLG